MATAKVQKGNKRGKGRRSQVQKSGLTIGDYNWGSLFKGTKAALIKAGLVAPKDIPNRIGWEKKYTLPLDHHERYTEAVYGPDTGPIPPSFKADISRTGTDEYQVSVSFDYVRDLAVRERADQALTILRALISMVESIPPVPVSQQLGIKAQKVGDNG